jgi:phosphosulfolactate synthase
VETVLSAGNPQGLIFEAFERKQQVWLVKHLGPNVNLGNIPPTELLTVESFRRGLKEHTLLHAWQRRSDTGAAQPGSGNAALTVLK